MSSAFPAPPRSEGELFARADALAGRPLRWLAARHHMPVPPDLRRAKGWIGQLLEVALGATASSRPEPDFPHLGVEMKTLPVDARGRPTQSTYVCTAPLGAQPPRWEESWVRKKLARVLWIPILGSDAPGDRVIGAPVLWSPSPDEDAALRTDWEELTELVALGQLWQLDGRRGQVLQLRPKGADGSDRTWALDEDGRWVRDTPRGFYLRARFTAALLARALELPPR